MTSLFQLLFGFLVCAAACQGSILLAPSLGLLDIPGGRRQHQVPVPRAGGLAFLAALLAALPWPAFRLPLTPMETGAVLVMGFVGLLDDRWDCPARWKACHGLALAVVLGLGAYRGLAGAPWSCELCGLALPPSPWLVVPLLVLFFWSLPQAFNLIDGANGLASGFGLVVIGSLWGFGAPLPLAAGALLACLLWNWPRALLFLGDCGSLSIGLLLVLLAQKVLLRSGPTHLLWLFAYPIADVLLVIFIRKVTRRPIFCGDRNHLHFQIMDRWPALRPATVPLLLSLSALCASELYLRGPWLIVPWAGLSGLAALACTFAVAGVARRTVRLEPGEAHRPPVGSMARAK